MYSVRLLGGVALEGPSGPLSGPAVQPRRLAVLAMLATSGENGCSRDKLVGHVWPEREEERARHVLATAVYVLRNALGEEAVLTAGDYVRLNPNVVRSDVRSFEEALAAGRLEEAIDVHGGGFLEGFYLKGAPEFERWVESERARLADGYAGALEKLADQAEAAEDYAGAVDWWKRLAALDAYNSRYVVRLMEALVAAGDPGNALQRAQEHERFLRDELDAEPALEVRELVERLKRNTGDHSDVRPPLSPPSTVVGEPPEKAPARSRRTGPTRALAIYGVVSFAVVVVSHVFTVQFGLPDWLFRSAVVLLVACLPVVVVTAFVAGTPAAKGWVNWRNTIAFVAIAFALLGVVVSGHMAMRAMGIGPWGTLIGKGVLEPRDRVVLADFDDHTGDSTLALTVTEAMRVDLGQSRVIGVASRRYVNQVLQRMARDPGQPLNLDLALEVAIRDGLKAVVAGEINRAGSTYVLSVRLVGAETGEVIDSFRESAEDPDAIIPAVDRLSARLRERFGESLKTIRGTPSLRQVRTASLEALRLYTESVRVNIGGGEYRRACDLATRAIEIDTLFVAAYRQRAHCYTNLGIRQAQVIADATKAYELRHLVTLREQYDTEGVYHQMVTGDLEAMINAWRTVLEIDPNWGTAYNQLGGVYTHLRDYPRAEEMFRRRLELEPTAGTSRAGLARSQFNQGKFEEAEETLRQWEERVPGHPDIQYNRALFASARGDYAVAEALVRGLGGRHRDSFLYRARTSQQLGRLARVQGKVAEAESHFRDAMAAHEEGDRTVGYLASAIELAGMRAWFLGDTAGALETVAAALDEQPLQFIEPIDRPYPALAGVYAFAGKPERAREILTEWETLVPPNLRRRLDMSRRLAWVAVAMSDRRFEEALAELRFVRGRDRCPICQFPLLGGTYESLGPADSAVAAYERFVTTPYAERCLTTSYSLQALGGTSPADGRDPFWLPVAYERLGDLYEQRGDTAEAIHFYRKLVDLWKDADPELQPRVAAAERAIRSLSPVR